MLSLCFIMLHYAFLIVTYNTIIYYTTKKTFDRWTTGDGRGNELVLGGRRREPAAIGYDRRFMMPCETTRSVNWLVTMRTQEARRRARGGAPRR